MKSEPDIVTRLRGHIAITTRLHFAKDGFAEPVYVHGPSPICQEAADEIERLRKERDALFVLTDRLTAEHDALRAERDEVRQSYCSLMEAYRGGDGRVTANKLGWGYLFEEDKPCQ